jgi:5-methyltetrahydropteroyltriglutamate--homocysteine methyltransferase
MANVFRADHVGALIKPESLLSAQAAQAAGKGDAAALRAAEDAAIVQALELQKSVVMTVVTDGELRRASPDEPYASALEGLQRRSSGPAQASTLRSAYAVCAPLKQKGRLMEREVSFLKANTRSPFKIGLTSPSSLALRLYQPGVTEKAYPRIHDLAAALGDILRHEIEALFGEGVRYVQLDGPVYHALFEGVGQRLLDLPGKNLITTFDELVALDVAMLESIKKPAPATLGMHIGRAADLNDGADRYERMVTQLLERLPVDRVLLEYAEPEERDFSALKALPSGKMAVLGLVRTEGRPEEIRAVIDRIEQAARMTAEENLALSPRAALVNVPGQPVAAQLKAQQEILTRTSEVAQQFWGLEL